MADRLKVGCFTYINDSINELGDAESLIDLVLLALR